MRKLFSILVILLLATQADIYAKKVKQLTPTITWELKDDGTLIISGTGEMPTMPRNEYPWAKKAKEITAVHISEGITRIGDESFQNEYRYKKHYQISKIKLPSTLKQIGIAAFHNCGDISSLEIPDGVATIYSNTFYACGIEVLKLPSTLQSIGESAFENNNITSLTIPEGVIEIKKQAFCNCNIQKIKLPSTLQSIGESAFASNHISTVTIPKSITVIGTGAFRYNQIANLTIPKNVTRIDKDAFRNNEITKLSISAKEIGDYAFYGNPIRDIYIGKEVRKIGKSAFAYNSISVLNIPNSVTYIGEYAFAISLKEYAHKYFENQIINLPTIVTKENCEKIGISKAAYSYYNPTTARDYHSKGYKYYENQDYATAVTYFLKGSTAKNPDSNNIYNYIAGCYFWAAECYKNMNDPFNELKMLTKAKAHGTKNLETFILIAKDKIHRIKSKEVEEQLNKGNYNLAFDHCIEIYNVSKSVNDLEIVPKHFEDKKDYTNAIKYYKKAYEIESDSSLANHIAELYFNQKDYTNAAEWYSIKAQQGDKETQYKLGQVYEKANNKNLAIFWYRKAAEQKHLKAEEALAHYGVYITPQQNTSKAQASNSSSSSSSTTKNNGTSQTKSTKSTYTPEYGFRDVWVQCAQCHGSGKCWSCHGEGWCVSTRYDGSYNSTYQCPICHGTGNCTTCYGTGGHYEKQQYQIR